MGWSVAVVVRRATGLAWDPSGVALLLLGIVTAYSLDRVVDAAVPQPRWMARVLMGASVVAALAGAWLLPALPGVSIAVVVLAGVVALAYPLVKRLPMGKTLLVPLVWTWCGIALPVGGGAWLGWRWWTEPVAVPLFLLFAAGCLLCDVKDAARDREAGVPSVPALVGPLAATRIAILVSAIAAGVALGAGRPALACSAAVLCGVALNPALVATEVIGPLVVDVVLTLPGVLIAAHLM